MLASSPFFQRSKKNFKFRGFDPSPQLKKITESFYQMIENRSPSDSKTKAVITKQDGFFEAKLCISSASSCSFQIVSQDKSELRSINKLQEQFLRRILAWSQNKTPENYNFTK